MKVVMVAAEVGLLSVGMLGWLLVMWVLLEHVLLVVGLWRAGSLGRFQGCFACMSSDRTTGCAGSVVVITVVIFRGFPRAMLAGSRAVAATIR